jgi:hypothetical protein
MVLTKAELIALLQHEVHILVHLAAKLEPSMLDYRPSPKQRSALELLRYLSMMGPTLIEAGLAGRFDPAKWTVAEQAAATRDFEQAVAAIAAQASTYATMVEGIPDAGLRAEIDMFGSKQSLGAFIVNTVLSGHAAYRTQLFLYLKSCGRTDLSTMNLWAGVDAPKPM